MNCLRDSVMINNAQTHKVPKIIHQIWIGDMPDDIREYTRGIQEGNPNFTYKFWDDESLLEYNLLEIAEGSLAEAFTTNILRMKILEEYGGIYIDCDCKFVKPLDELYEEYSDIDISSIFIRDISPDNGFIIAKKGLDYTPTLVDYVPTGPMAFYWQRMKPTIIQESKVGVGGSFVDDLRLNSWVQAYKDSINQ